MDRVNNILNNIDYRKRVSEIIDSEYDRVFCRHGYDHLLMVARLGWAIMLEEYSRGERTLPDSCDKELIYAAALLHDIGRYSYFEKEEGMDHRDSGVILARPILKASGFETDEIEQICDAINQHGAEPEDLKSLAGILFRADKKSRNCFDCDAFDICNWPDDLKNTEIQI